MTILNGRMLKGAVSAIALSSFGTVAAAEDVKLTMWSWMGFLEPVIEAYEAANPGVDIELLSVGNGSSHYQKVRSVLRGGKDVPDIAQFEISMVDTFRQVGALANLSDHGLDVADGTFVDWVWGQLQSDDGVYALPSDTGPMGLLYRADILQAAGVEPPKTWDEYYSVAKAVKASGRGYLANASFADGGWDTALLWQAGWNPVQIDGSTVKLTLYDDAAQKFAAHWQRLVDEDLVSTTGEWTPEWYAAFNDGTTASWLTAAWGPIFLAGVAEDSAGKWRATQMPAWTAGEPVSSNWGGSTLAVMEASDHKEEATAFLQWLLVGAGADMIAEVEPNLFSVKKSILAQDSFQNRPFEFFGGQPVMQVFSASSDTVDTSFQWTPFQDFLHSTLGAELAKAAIKEQTFEDAFLATEKQIEEFLFSQGFDVEK